MINHTIFEQLTDKARTFTYSSLNYVDFDECKNATILSNNENMILLHDTSQTPHMLYFATHDVNALVQAIADISGKLRLHFVPREIADKLTEMGFIEWAEFVDFWNPDLVKTASTLTNLSEPEYLQEDEGKQVVTVAHKCALQSRGFEGVALDWALETMVEGKVFVSRKDNKIIGFCGVSIYNKGTTLWIKVMAVDPAYQGQGIGKLLLSQAIMYGVQQGASKGFLATDMLNDNAIGLYNNLGFVAKESERELQMIRE